MVQIAHAHTGVFQIVGQVFSHLFGERCDQYTLLACGDRMNLAQQVVDLAIDRTDLDDGIKQTGRPNNLLDNLTERSRS